MQRVRLCWSERHERSWCAGASRPRGESRSPATSWTSFFRLNEVVDRWRERPRGAGEEACSLDVVPAPLPTAARERSRVD